MAKDVMHNMIRPATSADLYKVAEIHKSQFEDHLLGHYSTILLSRFYNEFLPSTVFLVHEMGNSIDGFVMGGDDQALLEANRLFVRRNLFRCIGETLLRPSVWASGTYRGIKTIISPRKKSPASALPSDNPDTSLLSIAVMKTSTGKGVAAALVNAFEQALVGKVSFYRLSVGKTNSRAVAFYLKVGYEVESEIGGSIRFRRNISSGVS